MVGDVLQEMAWLAGSCAANILVVGDLTAAQRDFVTNLVAKRRQKQIVVADRFEALPVLTDVLVVLVDASGLAEDDQQRLLRWIDETQPQILSFTCGPLFPLVRSGRFVDALFYRLNVLSFVLEGTDIPHNTADAEE